MPTLKELSRESGLSQSTLSRALNYCPGTGEEAARIASSLKEKYDMSEFLQDMSDIEWLLSSPIDNIDLMEAKFDELSAKYSVYVNMVNLFNYKRGMNHVKSSLREQLRLYYYHLPLFALMKHKVTKVLEAEARSMIVECA